MISITLQANTVEELLSQIRAFAGEKQTALVEAVVATKAKAPKSAPAAAATEAAPAPGTVVAETPATLPPVAAPSLVPSVTELGEAVIEASRRNKPAVKALIDSYGVPRATMAKQSDWADIIAKAKAIESAA